MRKLKRTIALFTFSGLAIIIAGVLYIGSGDKEQKLKPSRTTKHLLTRLKIHFAFDNSFYGTKESVDQAMTSAQNYSIAFQQAESEMTPFLEAAKKDPKISKYFNIVVNEPLIHSKGSEVNLKDETDKGTGDIDALKDSQPFTKILKDMNQEQQILLDKIILAQARFQEAFLVIESFKDDPNALLKFLKGEDNDSSTSDSGFFSSIYDWIVSFFTSHFAKNGVEFMESLDLEKLMILDRLQPSSPSSLKQKISACNLLLKEFSDKLQLIAKEGKFTVFGDAFRQDVLISMKVYLEAVIYDYKKARTMTETIEGYGILLVLGKNQGNIDMKKVDPYCQILVSFLILFSQYAKTYNDREAYEMLGTFVMILAFNSPKKIF